MRNRVALAMLWRDLRLDLSYRAPWLMDVFGLISVMAVFYFVVRYTNARAPGVRQARQKAQSGGPRHASDTG